MAESTAPAPTGSVDEPPTTDSTGPPSHFIVAVFTDHGLEYEEHDVRERTFGHRAKPYDVRKHKRYVQLPTGGYYDLQAEHRICGRTPQPEAHSVLVPEANVGPAPSSFCDPQVGIRRVPSGDWSWDKPFAERWAETAAEYERREAALERERCLKR